MSIRTPVKLSKKSSYPKAKVLRTFMCGKVKYNVTYISVKNSGVMGLASYFIENCATGAWVSPNYSDLNSALCFAEGLITGVTGCKVGSNPELKTGQYSH